MNEKELQEVKQFSGRAKAEICKMIHGLPAGHLGGSMSITDYLSVLYNRHLRFDPKNPKWEGRDYVVMSKGHCGPAMYATLAMKGFFPMEQLSTINTPHTDLPSHTDRNHTPGIDMTTGSLGQGASTAAGLATALKLDQKENKVYLILGDGELNEGQVWEMALYACTRHLDNLIAVVDYNHLQLDGPTDTDEICNLGDLEAKWNAFGWYTQHINGHDYEAIDQALENAKAHTGDPSMIIMDTVKGHGWSKAENQVGSHSRGINDEELAQVLAELKEKFGI
ncbi:MAG: transketolase [Lachnospiraceae bacterium]|nr:transketolase [Lachnospiraceae bacterium]